MMNPELHFLRPWWLLSLLLLVFFMALIWRQGPKLQGWSEWCDPHLLTHLLHQSKGKKNALSLSGLLISAFCMIIALAGPAWHKLPVATYKPVQPRVLLLDMSEHMMNTDLTPNRLSRAKFKMQDLLARKDIGQFGLIAYTGEPFVVSPLTDDGQTISALLSALTPQVMPVEGQNLATALDEAHKLIKQAGYDQGKILVLTSDTPTSEAIEVAAKLADQGVDSSVLPVLADNDINPLFEQFARSGDGQVLVYSADSSDLSAWINTQTKEHFKKNKEDEIPLWRDEGRWFLVPAFALFLPVFRRGWVQRITL